MAKVEAPRPHTMSLYHQSSKKKYDANKLNAQKSTGPKTAQGKRNSSLNGFKKKHMAAVQNIEGPEHAQREADLIDQQVQAKNGYQKQIRDRLAVTTCRINRSRVVELRIVQDAAIRAKDFWDIDRAAEAAAIGSAVCREPSRVTKALLQSKHGCEWLIEQWGFVRDAINDLALDIADHNDAESKKEANDKNKVPAPILPESTVMLASCLAGRGPGAEYRRRTIMGEGFVAGQVRKVEEVLARHVDDDKRKRVLAMMGQDDRKVAGLTAARNHELALVRHARWLAHTLNQPASEGHPEFKDRAQFFRHALDPQHYSTDKHTPYTEDGEVNHAFDPRWDHTDFDTREAIEERRQADEFCRSLKGREFLLNDKRIATKLTKKRESGQRLNVDEKVMLDEALRQMDYAPEDVREALDLRWLDLDTPDELLVEPTNPPTLDDEDSPEVVAANGLDGGPASHEPKPAMSGAKPDPAPGS